MPLPAIPQLNYPVTRRFKQVIAEKTTAMKNKDIAIIGLSGQYPQAKNLDVFWENLKQEKIASEKFQKIRWNIDAYYDPDKNKARHCL